MLLLLYCVAAIALVWLAHRLLVPLSRAAAGFLFLLPFAFVGHALVATRVYAPIDKTYLDVILSVKRAWHGLSDQTHNPATADIFAQMIPWRHAVRESVMRGEWPLWNPSILSGDILAAAAQPAPYHPFTLLALLLPAPISFTFTAAITFLAAALGTFLFARELGLRESAAAVAAVGFTYSTSIALYVLWPLGLNWALMPFVLFATRRIVHAPSVRSWGILTTALVLLVMAGHPESVLHIVAIGILYALFELFSVRRNTMRAIGAAFAAGAVALLVCAIYLLPYLEAMPQSAEYEFRLLWHASDRVGTTAQVLVSLATDFFPFLHLHRWIDPPLSGAKAESPAVGSIVLALAIYALWRVRSRTTWFFAALAFVSLGAHAAWAPVTKVLSHLPLFELAIHERLAFAAAFALSMLAAVAVDAIVSRADFRAAAVTLTVVLIVLTVGTLWILRSFVTEPMQGTWGEYKIFAELAFLGGAALLFALRVPMRVAIPTLVALLVVQRMMSDGRVHKSFPRDAAYPELALFEPLRNVLQPFRIVGQGFAMMPGASALYGWEDVRGYEALTFLPYAETYRLWCVHQPVFFNRVDDLSKPMLSMMNVRFAFAHDSVAPPPGWRVAARQKWAVLLENLNVIERAFIPRTVVLGLEDSAALDEMANVTDFRERAWLTAPEVKPYLRANGPGRVWMRSRSRLDVEMERDGWVVVSNSAWKGWRAYVDGRRVKIQRANVAFLGIYVPAGRHEIRLVYWPESFVIGRWISFAAFLALAVAVIRRLLSSRA
ncbi:MAG TPA: YfhO family protein [Thermoanaerobaculia bacterium]|nr:YfhO family protein [Thermoanaerobaculia bacterium]